MSFQSFNRKYFPEADPLRLTMIFLMLAASSIWLGYEFWRLLLDASPTGGIDIKQRYEDVFFWFRDFQIYAVIKTASYPPASHVILWPFVGWVSTTAACWIWGITSAISLFWLSTIFVKASHASSRDEKAFIFLVPLSSYAAGATIGNGQLIVHILPVLLTSILLLQKKSNSWGDILAATGLFILALVKPSIAAPFFWIILFVPGRVRAALLVVTGYAGLTAFAGLFQSQSLYALVLGWLESSRAVMARMALKFSYSNLHTWLHSIGFEEWTTLATLLALVALGFWIWFNRKADIWILISVTAIVARLWVYHAWYDDLLIAPAIITLFRITKKFSQPGNWNKFSLAVMYTSLLVMMAPGGHYLLPSPVKEAYLAVQVLVWFILLALLIMFAKSKRLNGDIQLLGSQT